MFLQTVELFLHSRENDSEKLLEFHKISKK